MKENSIIKHLTVIKGTELVVLEENSSIGNLNWITAEPLNSKFFVYKTDRKPELHIGRHSSITSRHIIDCTDMIRIGEFVTLAGFNSQYLTHSLNLKVSRQECSPIFIGDYCFIGTGCIILPGSVLPNYSVLASGSILNSNFDQEYLLYGGTPAKPIKHIDEYKYFSRDSGRVY